MWPWDWAPRKVQRHFCGPFPNVCDLSLITLHSDKPRMRASPQNPFKSKGQEKNKERPQNDHRWEASQETKLNAAGSWIGSQDSRRTREGASGILNCVEFGWWCYTKAYFLVLIPALHWRKLLAFGETGWVLSAKSGLLWQHSCMSRVIPK